jgi:hypothetical protein
MRTSFNAGVTGIAAATAALLVVTVPAARGDHQSTSSSYGVSVAGQAGQPAVQSDGAQDQSGGGQLPAQLGPLAAGGVLALTAGNDRATATVTDLTLAQAVAQLPPELTEGIANLTQVCTAVQQAAPADQVIDPLNDALNQIPGAGGLVDIPTTEAATTFCTSLLDADILSLAKIGTLQAECTDQTGTVTVTDVEVLGAPQPVVVGQVAPQTELLPAQLGPVARITLNHQTLEGEELTVDGLRLEVGGKEVAVLASATCGGPVAHAPEVKAEQEQVEEPEPAPVPTPVQVSAPVTG